MCLSFFAGTVVGDSKEDMIIDSCFFESFTFKAKMRSSGSRKYGMMSHKHAHT